MKREKMRWFKKNSLVIEMILITMVGLFVSCMITFEITKRNVEKVYLETMIRLSEQKLEQVKGNFDSWKQDYASVLVSLSSNWALSDFLTHSDLTSKEAMQINYEISEIVENLRLVRLNNEELLMIFMDAKGNVKRTYNYSGNNSNMNELPEEIREKILQPQGIHYVYLPDGLFNNMTERNGIVVSQAIKNKFTKEIYGYVFFMIPQERIVQTYNNLSNSDIQLLLVDQEGRIVSSANTELLGTRQDEFLFDNESADTYPEFEYLGRKICAVIKPIEGWDLYVAALIDQEGVISHIHEKLQGIIMTCFCILGGMLIFIFVRIQYRFAPLKKLVHHMGQVRQNEVFTEVAIDGGYEIRQLTSAYNSMMQRAIGYLEDSIKKEKKKREFELQALRMQINPHFIYNTLTSIKFLIREQEGENAQEAIDKLVLLMQNNISKEEEFITVEEELKNIENYGYLQRLRYGNRIDLQIHCMEDCRKDLIPKLILQPFLENAFFHAFPDESDHGTICVFIRNSETNLICEIIDNGVGFLEEDFWKEKDADEKDSIGIRNVQERLKLLYGEEHSKVIWRSGEGCGTIIQIIIPKEMNKM